MHLVHNNRAPSYLTDSVTATANLSRRIHDFGLPAVSAIATENMAEIRRALLHLRWTVNLEQSSVIRSKTNT